MPHEISSGESRDFIGIHPLRQRTNDVIATHVRASNRIVALAQWKVQSNRPVANSPHT